jgi:thiamine monophosphate kinase
LLFTARPSVIEHVREASSYPVSVIGEIIAGNVGQVMVTDKDGKRSRPEKTGWDHFKRELIENSKHEIS